MSDSSSSAAPAAGRGLFRRLGPGLITACVVIGPGSITTSSQVGAKYGYSMSWVVLVATFFMAVYITLSARLGVASGQSIGRLLTQRVGRWLAVVIGGSVFFISASFQFSNNVGVHAAFEAFLPTAMQTSWLGGFGVLESLVVLFNVLAITFLFAFKNLYKALERLMATFVGVMLVAFAINLVIARPSLGELALGFVPRWDDQIDLSMLGMIGTTFVITAAFYQSYLVRQKGWGPKQLQSGLIDARVGAAIMAVITLMIMATAGTMLRGKELESIQQLAEQIEPLFGPAGQAIFCVGLFSAAYSSFLVNSMIGGFVLSDGLGLGSEPEDAWPRRLTAVVLLVGMFVALWVLRTGQAPVPAIVAAQAVTVLAAPLMAATLLWLTNRHDIMGYLRNSRLMNLTAGAGFVLLLALAWFMATQRVWPRVSEWLGA